jgi:hypothetical protein
VNRIYDKQSFKADSLKALICLVLSALGSSGVRLAISKGVKLLSQVPLRDAIKQHPASASIVVSICVLAVGFLLCLWKRREALTYGFVEVAFGISVGFNTMLHLSPAFETAKIITIASCIYIVSRGFNNTFEAKEPKWFVDLKLLMVIAFLFSIIPSKSNVTPENLKAGPPPKN